MNTVSLLIVTDKTNIITQIISCKTSKQMWAEHEKLVEEGKNVACISSANPDAFKVGDEYFSAEFTDLQIAVMASKGV